MTDAGRSFLGSRHFPQRWSLPRLICRHKLPARSSPKVAFGHERAEGRHMMSVATHHEPSFFPLVPLLYFLQPIVCVFTVTVFLDHFSLLLFFSEFFPPHVIRPIRPTPGKLRVNTRVFSRRLLARVAAVRSVWDKLLCFNYLNVSFSRFSGS